MKGEADVTVRLTRNEVAALSVVGMALAPSAALAATQCDQLSDNMSVGICALIRISEAAVIALGGEPNLPNNGILLIRAAAVGAEKRIAARERLGDS